MFFVDFLALERALDSPCSRAQVFVSEAEEGLTLHLASRAVELAKLMKQEQQLFFGKRCWFLIED